MIKHLWFPSAPVNGTPTLLCPCGRRWHGDRLEPKGTCTRHEIVKAATR